ncbi:MAG: hypothetical protein MRK02_08255 [Candidatus Scalindua sp.]|nr:hypothetical protein [Candidatus Scalindua sp.]
MKSLKILNLSGLPMNRPRPFAETIEQAQVASQEARLMASQKDLLLKIFGIIVGTVGIAVTILKLF